MARVGPWVSCSSAWAEHPSAAVGPCADSTASQPNPNTAAGQRQERTVAAPAAAAGYLVIFRGEAVRRSSWAEGLDALPLARNTRRPLSAPALTRRPAIPIRTRPPVIAEAGWSTYNGSKKANSILCRAASRPLTPDGRQS